MTICLLHGLKANEDKQPDPHPVKLLCPLKLLGLESPGGVTGAYHYQNIHKMSLLLTQANVLSLKEKANQPKTVNLLIDVTGTGGARTGLDDLNDVTILNFSRLKEDLRIQLEYIWNKLGGDPELFKSATRKPEIFKQLSKRKAYKHIKIFVYPVWVKDEILTVGTFYGDIEEIVVELPK